MTPERWQEVERIYQAALDADPSVRSEFLNRICKGDADLLREVASLLEASSPNDGFLESTALDVTARTLAGETSPVAPGRHLGSYELIEPLGAGGMGEVWRALDTALKRQVAIKILPPQYSWAPERLRRFEQEARAAGMLNHPNVLAVYAIGKQDGLLYLVTELLEGSTLRERLEDNAIPLARAVEYASQMCQGLAAAHKKRIVHRDLKPENIFITNDGRVKILDFGLAKLVQPGPAIEDQVQTASGMALGTPAYMSPEQARGLAADHRSDIFTLGTVLYEMLAGRRPFVGGTSVETMNAILKEDPPPLSRIPPLIEQCVRHCLEKEPEERFQAAGDLAFALKVALSGNVQPSLEPRSKLRGSAWRLAACAFIAGMVTALALAWRLIPRSSEMPSFGYLSYSGRDFSPAVAPDGRTIVFSSDRDGQPKIWLKHLATGSEVALTEGPDFSPRFSADGASILFVRNLEGRTSLFKIASVGGEPRKLLDDIVGADFSPDGAEIAFIRWRLTPTVRSEISAIHSDGSESRRIAEIPFRRLQLPRWSPDGKRIAAIDSIAGFGTDVYITTQEGKWSVLDSKTELAISGVAWLASGDELIYVRGDYAASDKCELVRHTLASDKLTLLPWPHLSRSLDVMDDGKIVFDTSSRRSNLREVPLEGGTPRWLTRGISVDRQPAFSPDGERILFTSDRTGNTDIWQMDVRSGRIGRLIDHPADDMDPAYAPGGREVIWTSNRSGHLEVYMADSDGSHPRRITNDGVDAQNGTMTADRKWIVYTSSHPDKRGVWKVHPDGSGAEPIVRGTNFNPEVSPNGKLVLYLTSPTPARNLIRVARIEDGADQGVEIVCDIPKATQVVVGRARWRPDGRAIIFIGQDHLGVHGVYEQPLRWGSEHAGAQRKLAAFDPDFATESLGLSPDGKRLVIAVWDQLWSLMLAERVPGIVRPRPR